MKKFRNIKHLSIKIMMFKLLDYLRLMRQSITKRLYCTITYSDKAKYY